MPRKYGKLDLDQADQLLGRQHALKGPFVIRDHEKEPPALKTSAQRQRASLISNPIILPATSMSSNKAERLCDEGNGIKLARLAAEQLQRHWSGLFSLRGSD